MASDTDASLTALKTEMDFIRQHASDLPSELIYLLGVCRTVTGLQTEIVGKFLRQVAQAKTAQELNEEEYFAVCKSVKDGRLGDAKAALDICKAASKDKVMEPIRPPQLADFRPNPKPRKPAYELPLPESDVSEIVRQLEAEERRKETEERLKSETLARKLQTEYQREVESMMEAKESENLLCQKCGKPVTNSSSISGCGHIFHTHCLSNYLSITIREGVFPISCPAVDCRGEVCMKDLACLSPQYQAAANLTMLGYQHYRINTSKMISCPNYTCQFKKFFEGNPDFYCNTCYNRYCLRCRSVLHPGRTCESVKTYLTTEDLNRMFEMVKMGAVLKICPACMRWNLKQEPQGNVRCLCGVNFCTVCGVRGNRCNCAHGRGFFNA